MHANLMYNASNSLHCIVNYLQKLFNQLLALQ